MGTRHRQAVITKKGEMKIQQYGQWDGSPAGQGTSILKYLRKGNLEKYQENLEKVALITEAQGKEVDADENWKKNYPFLSRDCGSDIHQMIEDGKVPFVAHTSLKECKQWCEGFYTIDFKKGVFITEYYEHKVVLKLDALPTKKEYLKMFPEDEDED